MAEFDELRARLRDARDAVKSADAALAASRERLRRLSQRAAKLTREAGPNADAPRTREEKARLAQEQATAKAEHERLGSARSDAAAREASVAADFAAFSDPQSAVAHFDDQIPILMMPLRLETRFKDLGSNTGISATRHQLWVRIYPDDCWIDSFDGALTDTELQNTRAYWLNVWQAGGIESADRAAWRALVGSHGSGRAAWLVTQYQPLNVASKPPKAREQDVILTIVAEEGATLPAAEAAALATFWQRAWLAGGDATATAAARRALEALVGASRARDLIEAFVPVNFAAQPAPGTERSELSVAVAFVVFPAATPPTKPSAWAHAPKLTLLPDRFVFIGYRAGEPPLTVVGRPVPATLFVAPDPTADAAEQLQHDDAGNLVIPDQLQWLSNFERAEQEGMALRIALTPAQAETGFDRVLVLGLRANADAAATQAEFETLLRHHGFSRTGLSVVPQGTPTNNTDASSSGYGRKDDADSSFDDRKAALFTTTNEWLDKKDGQWLAEYLGVDPAVFEHVHGAGTTDQLAGRAMNIALWPATLGYWMETMLAPVFSPPGIEKMRDFFGRYVLGAGAVPAIRIGSQPYGILPATALSRMNWLKQMEPSGRVPRADQNLLPALSELYSILLEIDRDWRAAIPSSSIAHVGQESAQASDPHATLLDIIGLHSGSVEWSERYAESLESLFNRLRLQGFGAKIQAIILAIQREQARQTLTNLGYAGTTTPPILDKVFSGARLLLKGGVVDDKPLSEVDPIRASTTAGQNYIEWLLGAARTSLDELYRQDGFVHDEPPTALLYLMLRHGLQLGYHDVSVQLFEQAGLYTPAQALAARSERSFLHIHEAAQVSESRYQPLYATEPAITGSASQTVGTFIGRQLGSLSFHFFLRDQLAALERLKLLPTAQLERVFADHVDCCSYRLDAWFAGLVTYQLAAMRNLASAEAAPRKGLYLGAYAWIEALRPEHKILTPVELDDPELTAEFTAPNEPPLVRDSTNQGYIHAPSLNHAVTAAILRNGFISNASEANRQTMAVNLTSERVRTALDLLEGIRGGQGLADLLGYQFERGLHDRHTLAEVDKFILKLRRAFPLRGGRMQSTKPAEGVSIESIEARNVVDGLAFVEHLKATKQTSYPFGKTGLPAASDAEVRALDAEALRLLESHDAVADLALSEGVYQAVLGNYDRVASTYDAYARGNFPPEPDVIRTPLNGIGITSRVALHLAGGVDPALSPLPGLAMTPRAQAEPAVNAWLAKILPSLTQIGCLVSFREAATGVAKTREVNLRQLELQPADLIALIRDDTSHALNELDDRIARFALTHFAARPDVPVTIAYLGKAAARFSVFEALPLLRSLRRLVTLSRPLAPTDLALSHEAAAADDRAPFVDPQRLVLVQTALELLRSDLAAFAADLQAPLADLANRRDEILSDVDSYVDRVVALFARAASFGVPQSGWGFAYDFQRRVFAGLLGQAAAVVARWDARLEEFAALLTTHDSLPATASIDEHFRVLTQAERAVSTSPVTPAPATFALFRNRLLTVTQPAFANKRKQFDDLASSKRTRVADLRGDLRALLPISGFDVTAVTLEDQESEMLRFAEDTLKVVTAVLGNVERRLLDASAHLQEADDAALPVARVAAQLKAAQSLLGEDFRMVPEFELEASRALEFASAVSVAHSPAPFLHLTNPPAPAQPLDFPIDTWLHGVARVREKMHTWEEVVFMTAALGTSEPTLDALQFPLIPDDPWVGLDLAPGQQLTTDRLLYTAHFARPFDPTKRQCGLLLDEWTETIPGASADTGIAFHLDRPNSEAAQAMLLITPSEFRGAWQWQDLVDALNETLDLAKRRAIEPKHIDGLPYAPFLPATVMASQARQLTIAANLALNNRIALASREG